ncbi:penicillin-binding protein activator LpoB [Wenyingzhuangia sp. 2_MG-2023]|uniref:penicillin-binding protein activator LpoB n=1 Tax=Wenyingzhuangia sp. 2_MG-2023 TaxID=3062639 RepID=UPI0026E37542|nr:penicillin-binding protein activator LpoB [Wenyingzhuangia sp. 2_MG-2023]MDO6737860.1 penicillin-binding protein activator LpoB [Wenyingzhuangia sp. 2_MG-2023]MDO6802143.1 penicillin-binding protein activator LpoB [Wenyingzhuangia sp. 1_MG-2023]
MKKRIIVLALATVGFFTMESCSRKITRVAADEQIDISGRWNDTDAQMAAQDLSTQAVLGDWLTTHTIETGKKPVIIVGLVRNKSHEHIDAELFTVEIEKALVKSQRARVVQGGEMRNELRAERADQQENSAMSTVKKFGLETGADYMLQGSINSIVDAHKRDKVVYYQIDLVLTNIETNEKVWFGEKKIKKFVKN